MMEARPPLNDQFWRSKTLYEMSESEWESLCDGCAKCCLHKLEDEDSGEVFYTDVACQLLDTDSCHCRDYPNRFSVVPDCFKLTPENVHHQTWLPETCAYRLLAEGKELSSWHPLVSGSDETVHREGVSVRGRVVPEQSVDPEELEERIIYWVD